MDDSPMPVTHLDEQECWELLGSRPVGRLVTGVAARPEIFPVNFVLDGHEIVFRTAPGNKLLTLTINDKVAFEVDEYTEAASGWSVVVHGTAHAVESAEERDRVEGLGLQPWVPTIKTVFVAIRAEEITGRRFEFGPHPEMLS